MIVNYHPKDIDVVILVGGLGRRLSSVVKDTPKVLAPVNGIPFLDILINCLAKQGFKRFILCVGYLREKIIDHYRNWNHIDLIFSVEDLPLGTAGAIKNSEQHIKSDFFIVLNGDSYCNLEYLNFIQFHLSKNSELSIVVSKVKESKDFGQIKLNRGKQIVSFSEKVVKSKVQYTNSGIYLFNKILLNHIPIGEKYSNEYDLFPEMIKRYKCYGFMTKRKFMDIGTPVRYHRLIKIFNKP